jgi:hypothetical protein
MEERGFTSNNRTLNLGRPARLRATIIVLKNIKITTLLQTRQPKLGRRWSPPTVNCFCLLLLWVSWSWLTAAGFPTGNFRLMCRKFRSSLCSFYRACRWRIQCWMRYLCGTITRRSRSRICRFPSDLSVRRE